MKTYTWFLLAALSLPLAAGAADTKPIDPAKLPKVACSDLTFSPEMLEKYPMAPAACVEARDNKGSRYAKFVAKVYISDPEFMTVQLLNPAGDTVSTFSFKPAPNAHIVIDGKERAFHSLKVGEEITFWVAETRLQASSLPESTDNAWAVLPPR
jgi:hypothetical protein